MIIAAVAVVASCSGKFVANGTVEGDKANVEGAYVALVDGEEEVAVAELKDGKFTISAKADPSKICGLVLKTEKDEEFNPDEGYFVSVIPEKGSAEVVLAEDASTVTGVPLTEALNEYQNKMMDTYMGAQTAMMKLVEEGDPDEEELQALSENRDKAIFDISLEAYNANCKNAVGLQALYMILEGENDLSLTDIKALVGKGAAFIQENEAVQMIMGQKEMASETALGKKFKDIKGTTAEGKTIKLSDYVGKGRYVLIDFWASWCGPCMNAVPKVRALLEKYSDSGLDLVGINCWERKPENGPAKAEEMDMTWPIIYADDESVEAYGVEAIPTMILFDPEGVILERLVGDSGIEKVLAKYFE